MPDQVVAVAIHHLRRRGSDAYDVQPGNGAMAVGRTATRLIDELQSLYKRRASKAYGKFSDDTVNYPTSSHLTAYVGKTSSFEHATLALMQTLAKEAGTKAASTGGHVFFAHFERDDVQYFLLAIVTEKVSVALTAPIDTRSERIHSDMRCRFSFRDAFRNDWQADRLG